MLRLSGDARGAGRVLAEGSARNPDWPTPYERLAEVAYEAGNHKEAERLYRLALARAPENSSIAERLDFLVPSGSTARIPPAMYPDFHAAVQKVVAQQHDHVLFGADDEARSAVSPKKAR